MGTEYTSKKAVVEYFVFFRKKVKERIELLSKKSRKPKIKKNPTQSKGKHPEDKHPKQRKAEKEKDYKNEEILNS